jgi:hypothetical protein
MVTGIEIYNLSPYLVVTSRRAGSVLGRWLGVTQAGLAPARITKLGLAHTVPLFFATALSNLNCSYTDNIMLSHQNQEAEMNV